MPDNTTILGLPLILPNQAQKHVTHNEALAILDSIIQLAVISRTLTAAPGLAVPGDRYIVATGGVVEWAGQDGKVAVMTDTGWQFLTPRPGWQAHVLAESATMVFDGLVWALPSSGAGSFSQLGVSATPDASNRLSVSSPAVLLNHAGAGHQVKVNKAAAGDTASLVFQTGFSGRAEMGTAGNDNFSVKVSADGSAWFSAFAASAATGEVTLPQPVHLGGQATDPASPANGTMWLNTTTGEVKLRTAGSTIVIGSGGGGGGISDGDKGDITVSGSGAVWTIDAGVVGLSKLANIATASFMGRQTAGTGTPEVLSVASAKTMLGLTGTNSGDQTISLTGEVTGSGTGSFAATIAAGAVTNAKLAPVASASFKGRATAGSGAPEDLTAAQATALLAPFSAVLQGVVPASGCGTTNFLRADGAWVAPPGGGGGGIGDGDKGDITISGGGTVWTVDAAAVTNAKLSDMAEATVKGRLSVGTGVPEDLTATQLRSLLGLPPLTFGDFWETVRFGSSSTAMGPFLGGAITSGNATAGITATTLLGYNPFGTVLRSSTTANGGYRFTTSANCDYFGVATRKFRAKLMWRNTANTTVRLGYHNASNVTDSNNGAYFEVVADVISAKTAASSVRTTNATTFTLTTDTFYTFDIEVDAPATGVRFRIYEGLNPVPVFDETNTTNLPTSSATPFGAGVVATESSTTTTEMIIIYEMGVGTQAGFQRLVG